VGLIQFRGHFPKGGFDVHDGRYSEDETTASREALSRGGARTW